MGLFDWFTNLFPVLQNQILIYAIVFLLILIVYLYFKRGEIKQNMKVMYFAEVESLLTILDVNKVTPKSVYSKDDKRFMRRAKSWLWKYKGQSLVVWLAKVGSGITYSVERNLRDDDGKEQVKRIGTLKEGIENCLQLKEEELLKPDHFTEENIKKLQDSNIFICVDLERHTKDLPDITEEGASSPSF